MNPIDQQIAIAESQGWRKIGSNDAVVYVKDADLVSYQARTQEQLPNYLNDLNAMHEVEKTLSLDQRDIYYDKLWDVCDRASRMASVSDWLVPTATAAQRAEAYLRTINKWKD